MTRYLPSRRYLLAGLAALALGAFSGWIGLGWFPAFIPAALFLLSAALLAFLAFQPAIEIRDSHLVIGKRLVRWAEILRVERTEWVCPLVVRLTLADGRRMLLIYPGTLDASYSLLRHLRRRCRETLSGPIAPGVSRAAEPHPPAERRHAAAPRHRIVSADEEAEIERLYQLLKTVGHLDPKNSTDEK